MVTVATLVPMATTMINWRQWLMVIHWSNNGTNGNNNTNGNDGSNDTRGAIGTNCPIEWQGVFHISHASLHIEINDAIGVIGAVSVIDSNGVNEANGSPMLPLASLTPIASMKLMNRHLHLWIANFANDAIDLMSLMLMALIGDCGYIATKWR